MKLPGKLIQIQFLYISRANIHQWKKNSILNKIFLVVWNCARKRKDDKDVGTNSYEIRPREYFWFTAEKRFFEQAIRDEARIMRHEEGVKSHRGNEWNERGWRNYYSRFSTVCPMSPFPRASAFSYSKVARYSSAYGDIGSVYLFKIQWKLINIYEVVWKLKLCQYLND